MSKPKYQKGAQIKSLDRLAECEFIYLENKVQCQGWFGCWRLKDVIFLIENNHLFEAERRHE